MAERFKHVTSSQVDEIINNAVPINTKKATKFAVKIFKEWFSQQTEFSTPLEEMEKVELTKCLEKFYLSARQKDGVYYKATTLRCIRAGLDRYLQSPALKKTFSIITDPEFLQANKALDAFLKTLRKHGEIAGIVHKGTLTQEIVEKLFQAGQLGPANSKNPAQLQNTVWFYVSLYFGKRGRFSLCENQRKMTKEMLVLRTDLDGRQFYEINLSVAGALSGTKKHKAGIKKEEGWSNAKMFEHPGSPRCPVETVKNYLCHLHPEAEFFFQKPRALSAARFNPAVDRIWYCNAPLGDRSLGEMMKKMTSKAGIIPHLTNHCIRATTVMVLGEENPEASHTRVVTLSIDLAAKSVEMGECDAESGEYEAVTSLPVDSWTPKSSELYKKLTSDLIEHGNGDWVNHRTPLCNGEKRLFTRAVISEFPGKFFEYQFFFKKTEQRLKGLIQFGPYTQGAPGCVHGGASASMLDAAIDICVKQCYSHCIEASLSMDYKSSLSLGTTALVETWIDKVEGRIIFVSAVLKSPCSKVTYVSANALFVQLDRQGKAYPSTQDKQKEHTIGLKPSNVQTSSNVTSANSTDMTERKMHLRSTILQQLKDLKALKDDGVLLEEEFVLQKEKILKELNSL